MKLLRRWTVAISLVGMLLFIGSSPAAAANPEQVQDLGPKAGENSIQYVGQLADADGSDEAREHSLQLLHGFSEQVAAGSEIQFSYRSGPQVENGPTFDYASIVAVVRFSDAEEDALGAGLGLQAGLDTDGELAILESRFILEKKPQDWWAQGNFMVRRINDEDEEGSYLAYGGRASRSLGRDMWLGVESSGQIARISGFHKEPFDSAIFLGPTLFYEGQLGRSEGTFGLSYLRRVDEDEPLRDVFQISAEINF